MKFWKKRYFLPGGQSLRPPPGSPRVFRFNHERAQIVADVVTRVVESYGEDPSSIEAALNETAYHETRRLHAQKDEEAREHLTEWRRLSRGLGTMRPDVRRTRLTDVAQRMTKDIAGNFDPRVYSASKRVAPKLLAGIMDPVALATNLRGGIDPLDALLRVEGSTAQLQQLADRGTFVFVPTHSSNLDSLVVAQALQRTDLPPAVYGAGKNLFTNPILSFFMHNLGAYRVDRRIRADLYKRLLKTYSAIMIERGFHSLFFPGGTRSRSNVVEHKLKLGLAGSVLEAFARNQVSGRGGRVWFVPTTINYELVLEAESLVEDHLSETGRSRYIIEDDEFSRVDRWVSFFRKLTSLKGACVIRFGTPLDPFGNLVDAMGESLGPQGNTVDAGSYVLRGGRPVLDTARDRAYTRALGDRLVTQFKQETVVMVSQLVAHILYRHLVSQTPGSNVFLRMRERNTIHMELESCAQEVEKARDQLVGMEAASEVRVCESLRHLHGRELVMRAVGSWQGYHRRQTAAVTGGQVRILDPTLLFYYQNRLLPWAQALAGSSYQAAVRELREFR